MSLPGVGTTSSFLWNLSLRVKLPLSLSDLSLPLNCDLFEGNWNPKSHSVRRWIWEVSGVGWLVMVILEPFFGWLWGPSLNPLIVF